MVCRCNSSTITKTFSNGCLSAASCWMCWHRSLISWRAMLFLRRVSLLTNSKLLFMRRCFQLLRRLQMWLLLARSQREPAHYQNNCKFAAAICRKADPTSTYWCSLCDWQSDEAGEFLKHKRTHVAETSGVADAAHLSDEKVKLSFRHLELASAVEAWPTCMTIRS